MTLEFSCVGGKRFDLVLSYDYQMSLEWDFNILIESAHAWYDTVSDTAGLKLLGGLGAEISLWAPINPHFLLHTVPCAVFPGHWFAVC